MFTRNITLLVLLLAAGARGASDATTPAPPHLRGSSKAAGETEIVPSLGETMPAAVLNSSTNMLPSVKTSSMVGAEAEKHPADGNLTMNMSSVVGAEVTIDALGAPPGSEKVIVLMHMANLVYYYPPDNCACSVAYPYCGSQSKYCYKSSTSWSRSSSVCPGTCSISFPSEIAEAGYSLDECVEETSGFDYIPRMCFWVKQNPKQAVIAMKGTDSKESVLSDIKHIISGQKPMTAINSMGRKVDKYRRLGYFTLVTGHSLGGYLAELASSHFNVPGMGFQAPGPDADDWFFNIDPETGNKHTGDNGNSDYNILNAVPRFATGDRLGNLRWPYFGHYRPPVWLRDLDGWFLDAHRSDSRIETFYKLPNYGSITNKNILQFTERCPTSSYCRQSILPNAISCGKESYFLPGKPARRSRDRLAKRMCRRE